MSEPTKAVFLSYASQDAAAARRIAEALRAAGIEVWFDQSELRGGDAWDHKIRTQIRECALFLPVISANTQARLEGYFRLEWRLADRRTELMGKSKAFLLPVCVDDTRDVEADVPDSFLAVQWTRLPGGEADPVFCRRIAMLLGGATSAPPPSPDEVRRPAAPTPSAPLSESRQLVAKVQALLNKASLARPDLESPMATASVPRRSTLRTPLSGPRGHKSIRGMSITRSTTRRRGGRARAPRRPGPCNSIPPPTMPGWPRRVTSLAVPATGPPRFMRRKRRTSCARCARSSPASPGPVGARHPAAQCW